jgi:DNA-binding NarL/FixJ family response regulator
MEIIRVLIADDHTIFRKGVRALLNSLPNMEVVGEAEDGESVIQMANELQPDVILMDIQMPNMNGVEATRQIVNDNPDIGIIMLTMFDDDNSTFSAMRAGAKGYILKGASQAEMIRSIEGVANGQAVFGAGVAMQMVNFFANTKASDPFPELTEREHEVLKLIADGHSNSEIAEALVISPKTLRNHISNIFSKLQVSDRMQAIKRARDAGLHTE